MINAAAYNMLVNLSGLVGYTGGHVLGNFSVNKMKGESGTGVSAKIKDLQQGMKDYKVVLESGGKVIPGGNTPYAIAASSSGIAKSHLAVHGWSAAWAQTSTPSRLLPPAADAVSP